MSRSIKIELPGSLAKIIKKLRNAGFEAYVVGGAVRDYCIGRTIGDWDLATSASIKEMKDVFRDFKAFSLKHETMTIVDSDRNYEITSYRGSSIHQGIREDLGQRDLTINAMAYDDINSEIIDPCKGLNDISNKCIRAAGDPVERIEEDPLRMVRAIRIASQLSFDIDKGTLLAITGMADLLSNVSCERIRDELMRILVTDKPSSPINMLRETGLLEQILPELNEGYGMTQNSFHKYTVYKHIMATLDEVPSDPLLRLTALLHDIAKPRVRKKIHGQFRFLGHEKESAILAEEIMERLRFSRKYIERVCNLISCHMIGYGSDWGDGAVRRFIRRVGKENVRNLLVFRRADLVAHGILDSKMDLFHELEERVQNMVDESFPINSSELAVDGSQVMATLGIEQGVEVGKVLKILMDEVIEHPDMNKKDTLIDFMKNLN